MEREVRGMQKLGIMLSELREEAGVAQKDLARGIMSVSELSRLECGEKEADYIVLAALFERIGKSLDKLELVLSGEDYRLLFLREEIQQTLLERDYTKTDKMLGEYAGYADNKNLLHQQYMILIRAVEGYLQDKNAKLCLELLKEAMELTFPEWKEVRLDRVYLCIQEWKILLMIAYMLAEYGDTAKAGAILQWAGCYMEQHYTDGQEKVKLYPHCMFIWGKLCYEKGEITEAYRICLKGKDCLIENGSLSFMDELLGLEESCLVHMDKPDEMQQCRKYRDSIHFLYEITESEPEPETLLLLMQSSVQSEYTISNEMIREMREAQGLSQEELSEGICTQETLSRIENGKRSPNKKNFHKIMEKMGIQRGIYYGNIIAEHYDLYEKVRLYSRYISKEERDNAKMLLQEIEEQLELSIPVNRQFVEVGHIEERLWKREITEEQAIEKLKKLLYLTMPSIESKDFVYRVPYREEFIILNKIAFCYKKRNELDKALTIFEQIKEKYDNSMVMMRHHAVPGFIFYINYASTLEVSDELEKSEQIGKEGISHALNCMRGDVVGPILVNMSCIYRKRKVTQQEELFLRNGYYILKLYKRRRNCSFIKEVYKDRFGIVL